MSTANPGTGGRVIQGYFPSGRPNILQPSSTTPHRPLGLQPAQARPGIVPPITPHFPPPVRPGAVQPKAGATLPGKAPGPILPARPGAVQQPGPHRPGMAPAVGLMPRHGPVSPHTVQPASRPGQPFSPPKPVLSSPPRSAAVQPSGGQRLCLASHVCPQASWQGAAVARGGAAEDGIVLRGRLRRRSGPCWPGGVVDRGTGVHEWH